MKHLYAALGLLFTALGIIGVFLPLLPTTPFLLLAAALFVRSSPRLHSWLLNQKLLGPYIHNFMENKVIPLRAKVISITLMWATMLYCIIAVLPYVWAKILLLAIAVAITAHILSFKSK